MKKIVIIFLLSLFVVLSLCIPVYAFIGTAIAAGIAYLFPAIVGITVAGVAVTSIVGAAVNVGLLSLASSLLKPSLPNSVIGSGSPTYDNEIPKAIMTQGVPIPIGFGLCRIPGNLFRPNDAKEADYIKVIVGHCKGEIDEYLGYYINDVEWTDLKGTSNSLWSFTGTTNQAGVTHLFNDAETCNYRGLALTELQLYKNDEIRSLSNINAVARLEKCIDIGQDGDGTRGWTDSIGHLAWHWYIDIEGYSASDLDEDAFTALEEYASTIPNDESCIIRPPIVSDNTVKSTTEYSNHFSPKFAMRYGKSMTGGANKNSWLTPLGTVSDQRINFDLGKPYILEKIVIENYHDTGANTNYGMNSFSVQGSNSPTDFDYVTYADGASTWQDVRTGLTATKHPASNTTSRQVIQLSGSTLFRYGSVKIASNHGNAGYLGVRGIEIYAQVPRYSFNMIFDGKIAKNDAKKILWNSFNGRFIKSQGKIKPVWDGAEEHDGAGSLQTKSVKHHFTMNNILKGSFEWSRINKYNVVRIYYVNCAQEFKKDTIELRDKIDIDQRGEVIYEENCYWITNTLEATRRCRLKFDRRYVDFECWLTGMPNSQHLELYDRVDVTHTSPGWVERDFVIIEKNEDGLSGKPRFHLREYLSGVYHDNGFEVQYGTTSKTANPFEPSDSGTSPTVVFVDAASGVSSYSAGSVGITFDKPTDPGYSYTQAYISVDDINYYPSNTSDGNSGDIYINGLGTLYDYGDTVYVKLVHINSASGVQTPLPGTAGASVAIVGVMRQANWYFGEFDMWGGNPNIDASGTSVVMGNLDGTPKIALGASADTLNISNMATYPGFFADGDGNVRAGNAGGGFVATAGAFTVTGIFQAGQIHVPDIDSTADSFHVDSDGNTWWGCTQTNFSADHDNALSYILKSGVAKFQSITIDGTSVLGGDVTVSGNIDVSSGYIRAGDADDYVAITSSGLLGVSALLGTTFNIPSDGSAPTFSSGIIKETEYQIYDVGVLKISDTEDATPGVGAVGGLLANVNMMSGYDSTGLLFFRTTYNGVDEGDFYAGDYISGNPGMFYDHSAGTMNYRGVFHIASGSLIVNDILISEGGYIRTQEAYPYIEIGPNGIMVMQDDAGGTYGTAQYGADTYGSGALVWIMNTSLYIPWVEMKEPVNDAGEGVASFRLYNRPDSPDGDGAELGDMCYVDGNLNLCVVAGDPGTYQMVPTTTGNTGGSGSAGAGNQYVELRIDGVTYKLLTDGSV